MRLNVFRVDARKRRLKSSKTILKSLELTFIGLPSQRFDRRHFIRPEPHPEVILIDRPHPPMAHSEGPG